jgi:hypothetical protein
MARRNDYTGQIPIPFTNWIIPNINPPIIIIFLDHSSLTNEKAIETKPNQTKPNQTKRKKQKKTNRQIFRNSLAVCVFLTIPRSKLPPQLNLQLQLPPPPPHQNLSINTIQQNQDKVFHTA